MHLHMREDSKEVFHVFYDRKGKEMEIFSGESEEVSFDVKVCCGQEAFCFQRHNLKKGNMLTVFRMNRKGIETWNLTDGN